MKTGGASLRTRVTLAAIGVLALVLIIFVVVVNAVVAAQSQRSLEATLAGRAQFGRQLAGPGSARSRS